MNRTKFYFLGIWALIAFAGCSNSVIPPAATPQVNYVQGQIYVYYAQELDKTSGDTVAGSGDTIRSVVIATGISYQDMNGVTEIQNTHTNPPSGSSKMDTTYIAQTNGEYWHYNYGLESLNDNPSVLGVTGGPINAGWILQANFSAGANNTWIAVDTTLSIKGVSPTLIDSVTEETDTTIVIDSISQNQPPDTIPVSVFSKHSNHSISVTIAGGALGGGKADTYVSSQYGPVLDIIHPSELDQQAAPGRRTVLIRVP